MCRRRQIHLRRLFQDSLEIPGELCTLGSTPKPEPAKKTYFVYTLVPLSMISCRIPSACHKLPFPISPHTSGHWFETLHNHTKHTTEAVLPAFTRLDLVVGSQTTGCTTTRRRIISSPNRELISGALGPVSVPLLRSLPSNHFATHNPSHFCQESLAKCPPKSEKPWVSALFCPPTARLSSRHSTQHPPPSPPPCPSPASCDFGLALFRFRPGSSGCSFRSYSAIFQPRVSTFTKMRHRF